MRYKQTHTQDTKSRYMRMTNLVKLKSTGYPYLNRFCTRIVSCLFSFPYFCFLLQISTDVSISFAYFARQWLFLMFPLKIFARKPGRGRPELIPSRMHPLLTAEFPFTAQQNEVNFVHTYIRVYSSRCYISTNKNSCSSLLELFK